MSNKTNSDLENKLLVFHKGKHIFVDVNSIIMIQAISNYSTIFLDNDSKIFTSKTLKYWESQIKNDLMIRPHQSYLINAAKIKFYKKRTIFLYNLMEIKMARRFNQHNLILNVG